jgi:hypothetical protein
MTPFNPTASQENSRRGELFASVVSSGMTYDASFVRQHNLSSPSPKAEQGSLYEVLDLFKRFQQMS